MSFSWSRVKIGNGGFVTAVREYSDGTKLHRTDSSGAFIWNSTANGGSGEWQQLFARSRMPASWPDDGGGVDEVWASPSNTNHIWMLKLGQIFKSTDKGLTFSLVKSIGVGQRQQSLNSSTHRGDGMFADTDPVNAQVVYASSPDQGIVRSADGGTTWTTVTALSGGLPGRPYNGGSATVTPTAGTDTTSVTVGTGSKTFSNNSSSFGFAVGTANYVKVWRSADRSVQMFGNITAASGTSFTINVVTSFGSGTFTDWVVSPMITGDEGSAHCAGHRVLFDPSGGTTSAVLDGQPSQTVTANVYIHTYGVGTYKSTNGGVSWTLISASGSPQTILNWDVDPFGVLWVVDGDYTALPNVNKFDTGVWTNNINTGNNSGTFAGAPTVFQCVSVDKLNSPSKANTKVTFAIGDQLFTATTINGGSSWWIAGGAPGGAGTNRSFDSLPGNDVTWLLDYYVANPGAFFGMYGAWYSPVTSGKLWLASEGTWYTTPPTSSSVVLPLHLQTRGNEEFVATHVVSPAANTVYVGSWDFPFFRTSSFNSYPSTIGGPFGNTQGSLSSSLLNGYSLDYCGSIMAFFAGTSTNAVVTAVNKAAYSLDYGATVTVFPTQPTWAPTQSASQIACSNDGQTFVVVPPANLGLKPQITTNRGSSWADISITYTGSEQWGNPYFYLPEVNQITSDKSTGDIYLYLVNDGANNDPMYKWTKSTGLWTKTNTACGFTGAYLLEQLKSVPGQAGHLMMVGGDLSFSPGYCSTNGFATKSTISGFTSMHTMGIAPAYPGQSYPSLMAYGIRSGVQGYFLCIDFNPTTGVGTWNQVTGPDDLCVPKDITGDASNYGQFYSWTGNGLSVYSQSTGSFGLVSFGK